MKKNYLSFAIIAAAMGLASCGNETDDVNIQPSDTDIKVENNTQAEIQKTVLTFKAGYSSDKGLSKTTILDGLRLGFSAGDKISVFDGTSPSEFTGDVTAPSATCNFTGTANPDADAYHAIYPSTATIAATSATASVKTGQSAVEGSFDPTAHIMVATAKGDKKDQFEFKTVNAFIKFTAPCDLLSATLSGNNGENIAGNFTITAGADGYKEFTVSEGDVSVVRLVDDLKEGKDYYISYIPADFKQGVTLTLVNRENKEAVYKTKPFKSASNKVNKISADKLKNLKFWPQAAPLASSDLGDHLKNFTGDDVAVIALTGYNTDKDVSDVKSALQANPTTKVRLVLPKGTETIPAEAFKDCNNIVGIEIPNSVTNFGSDFIKGCSNLTHLSIDMTTIPRDAFNRSSITNVTFGPNVRNIGFSAFEACSITNLTIPEGVKTIEEYAFIGCEGITGMVEIPNGVTSIGGHAFENCNMTGISIPKSVTELGEDIIGNCKNFTDLSIDMEEIPASAFQFYSNITNLTIGPNVKTIGSLAFFECTGLTGNIEIPDGVTSIGKESFYGCNKITGISIPNSVKEFPTYSISDCTNLTNLSIDMETITTSTFYEWYGCERITNMTIGPNVKKIGAGALSDCYSLTSLTILGSGENLDIDNDAFVGLPSECEIHVTEKLKEWYSATYPSNTTIIDQMVADVPEK